mmetsp:Transcript_63560/g.189424  ORF Transcript_63560/g.189424 Transcript_63560/m.189424 type:complete len:280 (+) Transcript_63560:4165-5004(+)
MKTHKLCTWQRPGRRTWGCRIGHIRKQQSWSSEWIHPRTVRIVSSPWSRQTYRAGTSHNARNHSWRRTSLSRMPRKGCYRRSVLIRRSSSGTAWQPETLRGCLEGNANIPSCRLRPYRSQRGKHRTQQNLRPLKRSLPHMLRTALHPSFAISCRGGSFHTGRFPSRLRASRWCTFRMPWYPGPTRNARPHNHHRTWRPDPARSGLASSRRTGCWHCRPKICRERTDCTPWSVGSVQSARPNSRHRKWRPGPACIGLASSLRTGCCHCWPQMCRVRTHCT